MPLVLDDDFNRFVSRMTKQVKPGLSGGIEKAADHLGKAAVKKHMVSGGSGRSHPRKLTIRSGEGARSLLPGSPNRKFRLTTQGERIIGELGTDSHIAVHEDGFTVVQRVTPRQAAQFWAKYYAGGKTDPRFLAAALSKQITIKVDARPFMQPAVESESRSIFGILEDALAKVLD